MFQIRTASEADFDAITKIYAHHVIYGTGSFAIEPPTKAQMLQAWRDIVELNLAYLVAVEGDSVIGYGYVSPFRTRPGYAYLVEDSVYLSPERQGLGIGKALLNALIEHATQMGLYSMIAVIGDGDNTASIKLHSACGFLPSGSLPNCGYKLGRWLDVILMTRDLRPRDNPPIGNGWLKQGTI